MYRALASGRADVISAFSSDGRIAAQHLTVLSDPRGAIPGYDAILLLAPKRADDATIAAALRPLSARSPSRRCARPITWSIAIPTNAPPRRRRAGDRKSTRLNSSH